MVADGRGSPLFSVSVSSLLWQAGVRAVADGGVVCGSAAGGGGRLV